MTVRGWKSRVPSGREPVDLCGAWEIVFDPENRGRAEEWYRPEVFSNLEGRRAATVPGPWELMEEDYEGVGWYARRFPVPGSFRDGVAVLRFEAVNYRAEVWLNGRPLGRHDGGYTPFEIDATGWLDFEGENTLIVRVIGPLLTRAQFVDDLQQEEMPHWRGAILGGIWQPVSLLCTGALRVADLFAEPRLSESRAAIHVLLVNESLSAIEASARVSVRPDADPDRPVAESERSITLHPGESRVSYELDIPGVRTWSPEAPHLYRASIVLETGGNVADVGEARFGMREFTVRDARFELNGEPFFMKAIFDEGCYPNTLADLPDEGFARRQIRLIKEAGFNVLRLWRKPAPPLLLDLADEMGLPVVAAPAIECMRQNPCPTPRLEESLKREARELVLRDRNHPSIVAWEIFNEINVPELLRPRHRVCLEARRHDPSRLIIDESGGTRVEPSQGIEEFRPMAEFADGAGPGVRKGASVYLPGSREPIRITERHRNLGGPIAPDDFRFFREYGDAGVLNLITECGGGAYPDLPAVLERFGREGNPLSPDFRAHRLLAERLEARLSESGLGEPFGDLAGFCRATREVQAEGNREVLEALRGNPKMAGYCLHAWTGADWVIGSGIIDLWLEEPWPAYHVAREINRPQCVLLRAESRNVSPGEKLRLVPVTVNEGPEVRAHLRLAVEAPGGDLLHEESSDLTVLSGITELPPLELTVPAVTGELSVRGDLTHGESLLARGAARVLVLSADDVGAEGLSAALLDPEGALGDFLRRAGVEVCDFRADKPCRGPVLVTAQDASSDAQFEAFRAVLEHVAAGGCAAFLRPPVDELVISQGRPTWRMEHRVVPAENRLLRSGLFPLKPAAREAQGNWIGLFHVVRAHPVFEGLPADCMMGQVYANVFARKTMIGLPVRPVVGTVSLDWARYYIGLSDAWTGADLAVVAHGRGRLILSALRLVENLGCDPVAERIVLNTVRFASGEGGR
jgi:hypothetical protein